MNDFVASIDPQRFKRYADYKHSGLAWLGEIPAHWDVKRLKTISSVQLSNVDKKSLEGQEPVRLCNYTDVYYHERITGDLEFMTATATSEQVRRFTLRAADVLITKDSESWTDIAVPAVVEEDLPGVLCGYHLAQIRPMSGCHGPFLARAFSAVGPRDQFQIAANGITRFGLGGDAIATGVFAIPPEPEQRAIASFLDGQTGKIDALVAKNGRLIEHLQEKRTALITRVVTKGLDPSAPMTPSGVTWLGEIPATWKVSPLKRAIRFLEGPGIMASDFTIEGIPLLRIAGIGGRTATLDGCNFLAPDLVCRRWDHFRVRSGDLLISGSASTGFCAEVDTDTQGAIPYTGLIIVRPRSSVTEKTFLRWFFLSAAFQTQADLARSGTAIQHFGPTHMSAMNIAVPPVSEQLALAAFLDRETTRIDTLVAKVRDAIDRLKELRAALISAAVTGKIDVRERAA